MIFSTKAQRSGQNAEIAPVENEIGKDAPAPVTSTEEPTEIKDGGDKEQKASSDSDDDDSEEDDGESGKDSGGDDSDSDDEVPSWKGGIPRAQVSKPVQGPKRPALKTDKDRENENRPEKKPKKDDKKSKQDPPVAGPSKK